MNKNDLEQYRQQLLDLGRRLGNDVSKLKAETLRGVGGEPSGGLSNAPLHLADLGSDAFEHEVSLGLMENSAQILGQTRDALDRIDEGTYGVCLECDQPIHPERLRALPYTPHCVTCAQRIQEDEGVSIY